MFSIHCVFINDVSGSRSPSGAPVAWIVWIGVATPRKRLAGQRTGVRRRRRTCGPGGWCQHGGRVVTAYKGDTWCKPSIARALCTSWRAPMGPLPRRSGTCLRPASPPGAANPAESPSRRSSPWRGLTVHSSLPHQTGRPARHTRRPPGELGTPQTRQRKSARRPAGRHPECSTLSGLQAHIRLAAPLCQRGGDTPHRLLQGPVLRQQGGATRGGRRRWSRHEYSVAALPAQVPPIPP